ncbi:tRNA (N6-threonylcarbamoyladenosine(37)-N6)-methyltransferase TrmO [Litoribacillus peritrichatus]|uniref:tRNA (N6-threonylcarbamoyladenosine(37)-N6)-methyltransferase TrmO n=1 Tax=Litoribacillus peritrichatus TaxID=718191 RepID=A0ABP7MXF6_9GAMM
MANPTLTPTEPTQAEPVQVEPIQVEPVQVEPIGIVQSPFKQKFGIPRQPGLAKHASACIEIAPKYARPEAFEGIEQYSHLWIEFYFHQTASDDWKPSVRPPRLGGNQKLGCFATRTNFRPNNLGLSVVRFDKLEVHQNGIRLHISGHDLLDQTPIIDIKPYIPYSDSVITATAGDFEQAPATSLHVCFTGTSEAQLKTLAASHPDLKTLIEEIISQDPRPAYMKVKANRDEFTVRLYDFDIKWQVSGQTANILAIQPLNSPLPNNP